MERFPEHDAAVTEWFHRHGFDVTDRNYDFDREIFAWRSERANPPRTLRLTERILEDVPAVQLGATLERLRADEALNAKPEAWTLVIQEQGRPVLKQLEGPPRAE